MTGHRGGQVQGQEVWEGGGGRSENEAFQGLVMGQREWGGGGSGDASVVLKLGSLMHCGVWWGIFYVSDTLFLPSFGILPCFT